MVRILVLIPRVRRDAGARIVFINVQVQARDSEFSRRIILNNLKIMKEELYCIKFHGKNFVGTKEECGSAADEVYRKTRVVLGIVKYEKR